MNKEVSNIEAIRYALGQLVWQVKLIFQVIYFVGGMIAFFGFTMPAMFPDRFTNTEPLYTPLGLVFAILGMVYILSLFAVIIYFTITGAIEDYRYAKDKPKREERDALLNMEVDEMYNKGYQRAIKKYGRKQAYQDHLENHGGS